MTMLESPALASAPATLVGLDRDALESASIGEIVDRCGHPSAVSLDELPLLPRVASEILMLARNPDADLARMAALLHHDMVLAGHVLRIANSPAYLPRTPIISLQQAITRLGLSTLTEISLAASMQSGIFKVPGRESLLAALWQESLATAAWAREVARHLRSNAETAFLAGLLHAIGKPLLLVRIARFESELAPRPTDHTLTCALDQLYIEWGLALAGHWRLPEEVVGAIEHHLEPEPDATSLLPAIIGLSRRLMLAPAADAGADDAEHRAETSHDLIAEELCRTCLNLYPEDLDAIAQRRGAVAEQVAALAL